MDTPFISIGYGENKERPGLVEGDSVLCTECREFHKIKINSGKKCTLETMRCSLTNKLFLVGVDGKLLNGRIKKDKD